MQVGVDVGDGNLANVNGLPIHAFMGSTARSSMAGAVATTARFGRCLGCAVKKRVQVSPHALAMMMRLRRAFHAVCQLCRCHGSSRHGNA